MWLHSIQCGDIISGQFGGLKVFRFKFIKHFTRMFYRPKEVFNVPFVNSFTVFNQMVFLVFFDTHSKLSSYMYPIYKDVRVF